MCACLCACMRTGIQVSAQARRYWIPWSCSYRQFEQLNIDVGNKLRFFASFSPLQSHKDDYKAMMWNESLL